MNTPQILKQYRTIAVVGCSKDETKYSHIVAKYLIDAGYNILPVNPTADSVLGRKCFRSLREVPEKVGIVDVFRPSEEALEVAKQAIRIGAKVVWLQEGITSEEARKYCESNGLVFVQDKCTMKEHMRIS